MANKKDKKKKETEGTTEEIVIEKSKEEIRDEQADLLFRTIGVSHAMAYDLLRLANGDFDLVVESSELSRGINECRNRIIDGRLSKIENALAYVLEEVVEVNFSQDIQSEDLIG